MSMLAMATQTSTMTIARNGETMSSMRLPMANQRPARAIEVSRDAGDRDAMAGSGSYGASP
jgi:hypothetical protein